MQLGRRQQALTAGAAFVAMALSLAACSSSSSSSTTSTTTGSASASSSSAQLSGTLLGSGSTFQTVYQQAAIASFKTVQPSMTVTYGSGGSGKGRTDLASGVVNYAGSDSPIPTTETANFKGKTVLYFPVFLGPITISYNLSGVTSLKLDATVIADIFQGKITTWNNSAIAALNPGVTLPSTAVTIAVRSDSSGTTANFSLYLEKAAASAWTLGSSSTIKWPSTSRGGNGNGGVAQIIKSTPGAIGYVDYADAKASGLTFASVKNSSGNYIAPSPTSASAAGDGITVASNLTFHAVNSPNPQAYPVTYQSWVLVYQTQPNSNDAAMLKAYIGYLIGSGQSMLSSLGYAPLPTSLQTQAQAQLSKIGS